jgi:hypothetical protein
MKIRVNITETAYGSVSVEVPDGASEEEIYDAAYEAWCEGRAYIGDSEFGTTGWEKE